MSKSFLKNVGFSLATMFFASSLESCKTKDGVITPEQQTPISATLNDLRQIQISGDEGGNIIQVVADGLGSGQWSSVRILSESQKDEMTGPAVSTFLMGRVVDVKDADVIIKSTPLDDISLMCNQAYMGGAVAGTQLEITKTGAEKLKVAPHSVLLQSKEDRAIYIATPEQAKEYNETAMTIGMKLFTGKEAEEYLNRREYFRVGSEDIGREHEKLKAENVNTLKLVRQ